MSKVYIMDNRGREKEATKVRYFKYNDNNYFVYTLNEIDEDGYIKLYIKKIINGEDREIKDSEWPNVKDIIQEVFREIKAGTRYSYEDLNINQINEIMESGAKIFRLRKDVVRDIISKLPKDDEDDNFSTEIGNALANSLKNDAINIKNIKNYENSEIYEKKKLDSDLLGIDYLDQNSIDKVIENSKKNKLDEFEYDRNKALQSSNNLKPIVIGNIPTVEYKEKINILQQDLDYSKETIQNLESELRKYRETCFSLKKDNDFLHKELEKLHIKFDNLRKIIKDI